MAGTISLLAGCSVLSHGMLRMDAIGLEALRGAAGGRVPGSQA